ncbi:RND family efflux transporter MFP subunit [Sinobacterium caligoides]|uniref:RND family efflux transporter MFP subunit n=1 Tax=Sinobacterium caligoides TaxID=933926 RepID=A0A3N2DYS1_9GAMM|nr:efflux RND transporter periplasmic adaptor subunit [Sinobacterium caligoides]ROS04832.1 RND family efflux transporter MFP subunit [Sinobacterium caligoides]
MTSDPTTQGWLDIQCRQHPQITMAAVLLGDTQSSERELVAQWPLQACLDEALVDFGRQQCRGDSVSFHHTESSDSFIVCPIIIDERCFGVALFRVRTLQMTLLQQLSEQLLRANDWFSWLAKERRGYRQRDDRFKTLLELLSQALLSAGEQGEWQQWLSSLREVVGCSSIALVDCDKDYISRNTVVAESCQQVDSVARLFMLEAVEETARSLTTCFSSSEEQGERLHLQWQSQVNQPVCTIPLIHQKKLVGVLALVGLDDRERVLLLEQLALLVAAIWTLRRQQAKPKALTKIRRWPSWLKIAALALGLLFVAILLSPTDYYISAPSTLVSREQRVVTAATDGYLAAVQVRPGDRVEKGQLLALLDDTDLQLERSNWQAKQRQYMRSYDRALASGKRDELNIAKAQLAQASAQLELLENQLSRSQVVSPLSGVVLSGDLSQRLGAPLSRGESLFKVGVTDLYDLQLQVQERDLPQLEVEQHGDVLFSSLPNQALPLTVERVMPVAVLENGRFYFVAEAELLVDDEQKSKLTAGMHGVARVKVGKRSLLWRISQPLVERLSLWWWKL